MVVCWETKCSPGYLNITMTNLHAGTGQQVRYFFSQSHPNKIHTVREIVTKGS